MRKKLLNPVKTTSFYAVEQRGLIKHISSLFVFFAHLPLLFFCHTLHFSKVTGLLHTCVCFGSARFIFAVCFLSAVQTSSDILAVSVSFIEALKAYEVSGCGFNPNERTNNFKTGPLRGQNDVYLQCLLMVLPS